MSALAPGNSALSLPSLLSLYFINYLKYDVVIGPIKERRICYVISVNVELFGWRGTEFNYCMGPSPGAHV